MLREPEKITEAYGSTQFIKVKACFDIEKINFDFVDKKSKNSISCYVKPARVLQLCKEFESGKLDQKIIKSIHDAEQKNEKYPAQVWTSTYGGEEKKDGTCISRYFSISPGMKNSSGKHGYAVLTAYEYPANKSDNGAFIPLSESKALKIYRVPFAEKNLFQDFIIDLEQATSRYYDWRFSYDVCKSNYQKNTEDSRKEEHNTIPTSEKVNAQKKVLEEQMQSLTEIVWDPRYESYKFQAKDSKENTRSVYLPKKIADSMGTYFNILKSAFSDALKVNDHAYFCMKYEINEDNTLTMLGVKS